MTLFSDSVSIQASIAGSAIATLQKELSATHSAQKVTKSVKPPTVKPAEARVRAEPTPSPQFPFVDTPETFKSQADIEVKKEVGVSITGGAAREEHFEVLHEREAKVGHRSARCLLIHSCGGRPGAWPVCATEVVSQVSCLSPSPCLHFILLSIVWVGALFLKLFL